MFEKYTLKQMTGSNYCGGYALAAIINDINKNSDNDPNGKEIYDHLIAKQHSDTVKKCFSSFYKESPAGALTLPSSLVTEAKSLWPDKEIKVTLSSAFLKENVSLSHFETLNITDFAEIKIKKDEPLKEHVDKKGYYLLIVNEGKHWVAMGRDASGLYMYEPATGQSGQPATDESELFFLHGKDYTWSGVIIRIL